MRRNNDELVAMWGNLVNRTLQSAFRLGAVPEAAELQAADLAVLAEVEAGFETVGAEVEKARFRSALAEAMTLAGRVNRYPSAQAPWTMLESDRARAGTILYVALRCIDNLKLLLTPFLPHSSQRLHTLLGHEGWLAGPLELRDVVGPDGDAHTVLTGEYETWVGRWEPSRLEPGQSVRQPSPLFAKLDRATVVRTELERMRRMAS